MLSADVERSQLLAEEAELLAAMEAGAGGGAAAAGAADAAASPAESSPVAAEEGGAAAAPTAPPAPPRLSADAAAARLAAITLRLGELDASSAESRAAMLLAGLGFTTEMHSWPTRSLSGGWRMRTALACALFVEPDVLLGDELTVHLDARTVRGGRGRLLGEFC